MSKRLIASIVIAIALIAVGTAYATQTARIGASGGSLTFTTDWGDCRVITNNNGLDIFVPARTSGEWDSFLNNAPNKSAGSCCSCYTCQSPAANTWYVDYFIYTFDDSSCNDGWYGESGTISGEYWTVVEPAHAGLTSSIDTGNSCFWFNARGAYSRAYSRSPIYDNGGGWYYNDCGVCGGTC